MDCFNCQQAYNDSEKCPRLLIQCGHSLCESCIKRNLINSTIACPECATLNYAESVHAMPKNIALLNVKRQGNVTVTILKNSNTPSSTSSNNNNINNSSSATGTAANNQNNSGHMTNNSKQLTHHDYSDQSIDAEEMCPKHFKKFEAFCMEEKSLVCIGCILEEEHRHKNHTLESVAQADASERKLVEEDLQKWTNQRSRIADSIKKIEDNRLAVDNAHATSDEQIASFLRDIRNAADRLESDLRAKLSSHTRQQHDALANSLEALNKLQAKISQNANRSHQLRNLKPIQFLSNMRSFRSEQPIDERALKIPAPAALNKPFQFEVNKELQILLKAISYAQSQQIPQASHTKPLTPQSNSHALHQQSHQTQSQHTLTNTSHSMSTTNSTTTATTGKSIQGMNNNNNTSGSTSTQSVSKLAKASQPHYQNPTSTPNPNNHLNVMKSAKTSHQNSTKKEVISKATPVSAKERDTTGHKHSNNSPVHPNHGIKQQKSLIEESVNLGKANRKIIKHDQNEEQQQLSSNRQTGLQQQQQQQQSQQQQSSSILNKPLNNLQEMRTQLKERLTGERESDQFENGRPDLSQFNQSPPTDSANEAVKKSAPPPAAQSIKNQRSPTSTVTLNSNNSNTKYKGVAPSVQPFTNPPITTQISTPANLPQVQQLQSYELTSSQQSQAGIQRRSSKTENENLNTIIGGGYNPYQLTQSQQQQQQQQLPIVTHSTELKQPFDFNTGQQQQTFTFENNYNIQNNDRFVTTVQQTMIGQQGISNGGGVDISSYSHSIVPAAALTTSQNYQNIHSMTFGANSGINPSTSSILHSYPNEYGGNGLIGGSNMNNSYKLPQSQALSSSQQSQQQFPLQSVQATPTGVVVSSSFTQSFVQSSGGNIRGQQAQQLQQQQQSQQTSSYDMMSTGLTSTLSTTLNGGSDSSSSNSNFAYQFGGFLESANYSIDRFNSATNSWEIYDVMPSNRSKFCAVFMGGSSTFMLIGGKQDGQRVGTIEEYNPRLKIFTKASLNLSSPRSGFGAIVKNDVLTVIGGNDGNSILDSVETYDFLLKKISVLPRMLERRDELAVAVGKNGHIYAIGGFGSASNPTTSSPSSIGDMCLSSVERYNPLTFIWERVAPLNKPRRALTAVTLIDGIYAVGGFDGHTYLNSVEKYDENLNRWVVVSSMNSCRCTLAAIAAQDSKSMIIFGGFDGSPLASVERYDVMKGTWENLKDMPNKRFMHCAVVPQAK